jgi:hypothetical protein
MPLSDEFISGVLCTMIESGYGWFDWEDEVRKDVPKDEDPIGWRYVSAKAVEVDPDGDGEDGQSRVIDGHVIAEAIEKILKGDMVRRDIADALRSMDAGNVDMDVADCIAQVAVFGELRYG